MMKGLSQWCGGILVLGTLGKIVVVERLISALTYSVDALMIYFIINDPIYGAAKAFVWGGLWNLFLCSAIVILNNYLARNGFDMTGLGDIRGYRNRSSGVSRLRLALVSIKNWFFAQKAAIFWIGSWFRLDPDYVTIAVQRSYNRTAHSLVTITLPSVVLAMSVWTPFYWLLYRQTGLDQTEFMKWLERALG